MELKHIIESILFASQKPLSSRELREILIKAAETAEDPNVLSWQKIKEDQVLEALAALEKDFADMARSFRLVSVAGSWQFVSQPDYFPWLRALLGEKTRPPRLSQPALETLAIIAYRQPLTRAEIEQVRGVSVDGVMQTLLERGLIEQTGRAEVVGRPMTYGTTPLFLEYFGLRSLDDLPAADELRKVVVQKPETLLTADSPAPLKASNGHSAAEEPVAPAPAPTENAPAPAEISSPDPSPSSNPEP